MSVNLIATIEVRPDGFERFCAAVGEIVSIVGEVGWRLVGAYQLRTGQLYTVIDVWQLDDFNHLDIGLAALARHPRFAHLRDVLHETIAKETLALANRLDYPTP
jgi:NIPSNAP